VIQGRPKARLAAAGNYIAVADRRIRRCCICELNSALAKTASSACPSQAAVL